MKLGDKYLWTKHSQYKMRHYRLSAQRIKRVIRYPTRIEEAVIPNLIAAMSPAFAEASAGKPARKNYSEIWTIYKPVKNAKQIKIITAWRYPGKSPARNPIPQEILNEVKSII